MDNTQPIRYPGHYWVRFGTLWIPGSYFYNAYTRSFDWCIVGFQGTIPESSVGEVGERILPRGYEMEVKMMLRQERRKHRRERLMLKVLFIIVILVTSFIHYLLK